jgi:voltage-gated potassium channel
MISFFVAIGAFFRAIWRGFKDPEFRAIFITVVVLLAVGTLFYMRWEQWAWYDALLFCVATLTTIGYGDRVPTHPGTKIFTIIYIFIGIGVLVAFLSKIAGNMFTKKKESKDAEINAKQISPK